MNRPTSMNHDQRRAAWASTMRRARRIKVVGTSGSGKTTVANRLAEITGWPAHSMDQLFWRPNWQHASDAEFHQAIETATSGERWILDGNYSRADAIQWRRLTTVVWVDFRLARTITQAFRRAVWRAWTRTELWPETGNRESFRRTFFSRESVLLWTLTSYHRNRRKYVRLMNSPETEHLDWIHLRDPSDVEIFWQVAEHPEHHGSLQG